MWRILCGATIVTTFMLGCSDPTAKFKTGAVSSPKWDALDKLTSQDLLYPIVRSAEMNDWKGVKTAVSNPEFKAAVDAFASASIPSEFATDARKKAKDDAVKHYQALIKAAAEDGSDSDLKTAFEAAQKSMADVGKPDTGSVESGE